MARYRGPRSKVSRRFGIPIFGPDKALEKKKYGPGVHGPKSRRKQSDYAVAMGEKQKLKMTYGVLEKQFRRYFEKALHAKGITGDNLMTLLETRLDNVVFRLGFATTRRFARQLVNHGHILVNGRKVSIASYCCRAGDTIEVRDNPKTKQVITSNLEFTQITPVPEWLSIQKESFRGNVARVPTREEIGPVANEQLVVELYSR